MKIFLAALSRLILLFWLIWGMGFVLSEIPPSKSHYSGVFFLLAYLPIVGVLAWTGFHLGIWIDEKRKMREMDKHVQKIKREEESEDEDD